MLNKTINGNTIKHKLGEGGMADVWYAENKIGKPAAVKILHPDLALNASIAERFLYLYNENSFLQESKPLFTPYGIF